MNILLLTTHFRTGGITSYCFTLAKFLSQQGHKVIVVSSGGDRVRGLKKHGVEHIHCDVGIKSILHWKLYAAINPIAKIVKENDVDVIHAQTRVTQMLAAFVSRITKVPYVSTCHGFFKAKFFRRLFPFWGQRAIAISSPVKAHLQNDFGLQENKIDLIPNGIDTEKFAPVDHGEAMRLRDQWNLIGAPVIGNIGRLSDVKGLDILIDAVPLIQKKYPALKCLIMGEGPMEQTLKKRVQDLGLEQDVLFYKVVHNVSQVMCLMDVFVMPSYQEGLGLSAMEAQSCELPVVASHVGGLVDIIQDGKTGRTIPPGNSDDLARVVIDLLDHPQERLHLGRTARQFIIGGFSAQQMTAKTADVYRQAKG